MVHVFLHGAPSGLNNSKYGIKMKCTSCCHARQAGNQDLIGCYYWTEIFRGNRNALRNALEIINEKENYNINMDSPILDKEAIGFLIDILIEDYAPKPLYEGWADLDLPYHQISEKGEMTDSCVVINPQSCCEFYLYHNQKKAKSRNIRNNNVRDYIRPHSSQTI